jgi:mono/diheme cytochrome c family protein
VGIRVTAQAQAPVASDTRIWEGVYSPAQATRGKAVYEAYCTRCHGLNMVGGREGGAGGPALAGNNFWLDWERSSLASLYSKVSKTMPYDSPASLRSDDYADVLAYILSGNTFPAGTAEIPSTGDGLDAVRIVRKAGDVAATPNFSIVAVVGCLAPGAGGGWTLTRTTAPTPTRDEVANAAALTDAAARDLGADTVRLIGASHFTTALKSGQKAEVRGLLNRATGETRLDVLSLQTVGACAG